MTPDMSKFCIINKVLMILWGVMVIQLGAFVESKWADEELEEDPEWLGELLKQADTNGTGFVTPAEY